MVYKSYASLGHFEGRLTEAGFGEGVPRKHICLYKPTGCKREREKPLASIQLYSHQPKEMAEPVCV